MQKLVGIYNLGGMNVQIWYSSEWGGEFYNAPDKISPPKVVVGFGSGDWERVITVLLHELFEFELHRNGLRYDRSNDYGNDLSSYTFLFDHQHFSDLCGRVASVMTTAVPALAVEFKKYQKTQKNQKKKK